MASTHNAQSDFGHNHFSQVQLGDKRRNRRLVALANELTNHPGGTLPHKLKNPADLTALYRLCRCEKVTHEALMNSSTQYVRQQLDKHQGDILILHDATELDYTSHQSLKNLGQLGSGNQRGFIAHNSLAVDPKRREALGLVNQILHVRAEVNPHETQAEKRMRSSRESRLWLAATETLPCDSKYIDVCDSAADTFEFLEHELKSGRRFVIRSGYKRRIRPGHQADEAVNTQLLQDCVRQSQAVGDYQLLLNAKPGCSRKKRKRNGKLKHPPRQKRTAELQVSITALQILPSKAPRGESGTDPLPVWVVRAWEPNPPGDEEPVDWSLLTNMPVKTMEEARQVIEWYTARWMIEEYHKAMKTGCGIESLQFHSEDRLKPAIALMSILAVTLLRLRDAGRATDAKERLATDFVDRDHVRALSLWRHREVRMDWSISDFVLALGRLGGHQNRAGDGPPGWITLWRGWADLMARVDAMGLSREEEARCA